MPVRPVSLLLIFLLFSAGSCKKKEKSSPDKLPGDRSFISKEVIFDNPLRVFTSDGEVTNQGIINSFYYRYPNHFPANDYPYIDTLKTVEPETVLFGMGSFLKESFAASLSDQILTLVKKDTITDLDANYQTRYLNDLLNQSLERFTYFTLDTLANDTLSKKVPYIRGVYKDNSITLPFTRILFRSGAATPAKLFTEYAYLKPSPMPLVERPNDTIVLLQGSLLFYPY